MYTILGLPLHVNNCTQLLQSLVEKLASNSGSPFQILSHSFKIWNGEPGFEVMEKHGDNTSLTSQTPSTPVSYRAQCPFLLCEQNQGLLVSLGTL